MNRLLLLFVICLPLVLSNQGQSAIAEQSLWGDNHTNAAVELLTQNTPGEPDTKQPLHIQSRSSAAEFLNVRQVTPEYVLVAEFLPEQRAAKFFKNLINPDEIKPWFFQNTSLNTHHRIAGWKFSNLQYTNTHVLIG